MPHDERAGRLARNPGAFTKNELYQTWVLVDLSAEFLSFGARDDGSQVDEAAFRARDDLACDHDHVSVGELDLGARESRDDDLE